MTPLEAYAWFAVGLGLILGGIAVAAWWQAR